MKNSKAISNLKECSSKRGDRALLLTAFFKKRGLSPCFHFLLILAGFLAYSNSFSGDFIFDDIAILNNIELHHLWPVTDVIRDNNRPLLTLSLAVNYALGGVNVRGYHIFNLCVHILASLLLFKITHLTFLTPRLHQKYGAKSLGLAFCVALLWMIHPLQTQSVTYIIQRAESMMALFYLLSLYSAIRCMQSGFHIGWTSLAVTASMMGLSCKEVAITAPVIILLYDRIFWEKSFREIFTKRKILYLGLLSTWWVTVYLLTQTKQFASTAGFGFQGFTPFEYALTQPGVICHYLKLVFLPDNLVLDYLWPPARTLSAILPPAVMIILLLAATIWLLRRNPALGFLGCWFFIILSVSSSFIPIADMAFEHRMYLPLAAIIVLVILGSDALLDKFLKEEKIRDIAAAALLIMGVSIYGRVTYIRNFDYHSEAILLKDTIKKRPQNVRAHIDLGLKLVMGGEYDPAMRHLRKAISLKPDSDKAYHHLGLAEYHQKNWQMALQHFKKAVELNPNYDEALGNQGLTYAAMGEFEAARNYYAQAIAKNENYAEGHNNMCSLLLSHGYFEDSIEYCLRAIKIKPHYETPYNNLGAAHIHMGKLNQARAYLEKALELKPDYAKALNNLGVVLKMQRQYAQALKLFDQAVRLDPDYEAAQQNKKEVTAILSNQR